MSASQASLETVRVVQHEYGHIINRQLTLGIEFKNSYNWKYNFLMKSYKSSNDAHLIACLKDFNLADA